jgi:uncharacterized protein
VKGVFVDASAWYAASVRNARDHRAVAAVLAEHRGQLVTSNFVIAEALTLFLSRLGWQAARRFGDEVRTGRLTARVPVEPADEDAAWAIFVRYHDHDFSFTDCTSFALMRRLRLDTAVAIDSDFRTFGFRCLP